jgi:hypothetical protein
MRKIFFSFLLIYKCGFSQPAKFLHQESEHYWVSKRLSQHPLLADANTVEKEFRKF